MSFITLRSAILAAISIGCVFSIAASAAEPVFQPVQALRIGPGGKKSKLIIGPDGYFYGTTEGGGASDLGTIYKVSPAGHITVLHSFNGANGSRPVAALTYYEQSGIFYGTTYAGGNYDKGTIFKITPAGVLTTLYHFHDEGINPNSALVRGSMGWYGTTDSAEDCDGVLYTMAETTSGFLDYQLRQRFYRSTTGTKPKVIPSLPIDYVGIYTQEGGLYGYGTYSTWGYHTNLRIHMDRASTWGPIITGNRFNSYIGTYGSGVNTRTGGIFSMGPEGYGGNVGYGFDSFGTEDRPIGGVITDPGDLMYPPVYCFTEKVNPGTLNTANFYKILQNTPPILLSSITYQTRGELCESGFTKGNDGKFYGATESGGAYNAGRILRVSTEGEIETIASFNYAAQGDNAFAELVEGTNGLLYGTTRNGGTSNFGTVFKVTTAGDITTIFNFNANSGFIPMGGLTLDPDGSFYGTTMAGGANFGAGTLYKISPDETFTSIESYRETGAMPMGGALRAADGNYYIPLSQGDITSPGPWSRGAIIRRSGNSSVVFATFDGTNGAFPYSSLIQGTDGNIYGTTRGGGNSNKGTVFRLTLGGTLTSLYSFDGSTSGSEPMGRLLQGTDGNFYGTTSTGGTYGDGTIFRITPSGSLTTLVHLQSAITGSTPLGGLTKGPDGNYYGTTSRGATQDSGTLFRITPSGAFQNVYIFGGTTYGAYPCAAPILASDGSLYGITASGGTTAAGQPGGGGQIYRLKFTTASDIWSFSQLDLNNSNGLSLAELAPLYAKTADRQKAFTALNTDKSQEISYQELLAGKTKLPAVAAFFTRATAFQELDLDANGTLSAKEIDAMFPPGTTAKTRSAYGTYTFATWFSAKTIPGTALWTQAVQTRRQRADFALRLDVNSDGYITQSEFAKMYSSRTKEKTIASGWIAATATAKKATPPTQITTARFIEAPVLPGLVIY